MDIERKSIKKANLEKLFDIIKNSGKQIIAPKKKADQVNFEKVSSFTEITDDYIVTNMSAKSVVFPKVEKLFEFTTDEEGKKVKTKDLNAIPEVVLWGARPCDAMGFGALNAIFTWDYVDEIFTTRLQKTTIISFSCNKSDEYCFCTSVGGGPGNVQGSDMQLTYTGNDAYLVEIITEKGKAIADLTKDLFEPAPEVDKAKHLADVPVKFDQKVIKANAEKYFESDLWLEQSLRCLGCGSCAFNCPTCACFDIQDEGTQKKGERVRLWDSCGLALFTLHTSGHNPREVQSQRWRQRIMHKFSYMPDRQSVLGCEGCGRCSKSCPVDMNILQHLINISEVK
ncbi:MAG: 4Fe-4S dicluster domain-containing protein [Bacteroidota bacterium]|nr:4Fe-4S dicluster domain-containing protein [Bacteroidota bacterium]